MAIITPNMSLTVPVVGSTAAPDYGLNINACFSILDQHDHTPGNGVAITPDGLNITTDLSIQSHNLLNVRSVRFSVQSSPISLAADRGCLSVSGVDLYYNDVSGNIIRLTQGGSIAGAVGSISGLVAPASATYTPGISTFTFQSNTNTSAALDHGPLTLRNIASLSKGITLSPPGSLPADYTLTLPSANPAATGIVQIDPSGNVSNSLVVDNSTLEIVSSTLQVKDNGITDAKINDFAVTNPKIDTGAVTTIKIADANVTSAKIQTDVALAGSSVTINSRATVIAHSSSASQLRILTGNVNSSQAVGRGVGFTTTSINSSTTRVNFNVAFASIPIVTATIESATSISPGSPQTCVVTAIGTSSVTIQAFSNGNAAVQAGFNFIAIGT